MKNLSIELANHPGSLAEMGEVLGRAGISIEGGGAFLLDGKAVANFLFEEGTSAAEVLSLSGFRVLQERDVVMLKLNQDQPGQLGKLLSRMAEAGINIEVQYSDHQNQLVLVVDNFERARTVSESWMHERSAAPHPANPPRQLSPKQHCYAIETLWTGNTGTGTSSYGAYQRDYSILAEGKPPIEGSSDPAFRGDNSRYNPEEMLVAAISSCHMLWYLHLCAVNDIVVLSYRDTASGKMQEQEDGSGKFVQVELRPMVTIEENSDSGKARNLHDEAHRKCFIANSLSFPVQIFPEIAVSTPNLS